MRTKTIKQSRFLVVWMVFFIALAALLAASAVYFVKKRQKISGLKGDFYEGQGFNQYIATAINPAIDFTDNRQMGPLIPKENFSARWQGFLIVPKGGMYTFFVKVNGRARLLIDGTVLIEGEDKKSREFGKEIFLNKGRRWLCLEYSNASGESMLKLFWAFAGEKKQIIPTKDLRSASRFLPNINLPRTQVLIFTPQDVRSGVGWIQPLGDMENLLWPSHDQLFVSNPRGRISVAKNFVIPKREEYEVTVFHTTAVDYAQASVRMSCVVPLQMPMESWGRGLFFGKDVYFCQFPAGDNSITIYGIGNNKESYLGVNSIVLEPF